MFPLWLVGHDCRVPSDYCAGSAPAALVLISTALSSAGAARRTDPRFGRFSHVSVDSTP